MDSFEYWIQQLQNRIARDSKGGTPRALAMLNHAAELGNPPFLRQLMMAAEQMPLSSASEIIRRLDITWGDMLSTLGSSDGPAATEFLPFAEIERKTLGHHYLGTEHLLLSILAHKANPAAVYLLSLGLDMEFLREEVLKHLDPNFVPDALLERPNPGDKDDGQTIDDQRQ